MDCCPKLAHTTSLARKSQLDSVSWTTRMEILSSQKVTHWDSV